MLGQKISVIIRTCNEARWIGGCLRAVSLQNYCDVEIVLVDNESDDGTLEIAKQFDVKVISIGRRDFHFSKALNLGIEQATGGLIAILSGHCIPVNDHWLSNMELHFHDPAVMGVYGRQEPLPDTADVDKRDLWITFGLDRKIQKRDFFFHNANSMIRRAAWEQNPFSETINGVEDQEWAKQIQKTGGKIIYEPTASVFHFHGIHHSGNQERAARVVRMIELIRSDL